MASILDLNEQFGVFAAQAMRVPMNRDPLYWPRRTGGLTAYFVSEGAAVTESSAAWDSVNLTAKKLRAFTKITSELAEDAIIDLADWVTNEIAYAFSSKEDDCGFNGDGTSTYGGITGIVTKFATTATAGVYTATGHTDFSAITAADVANMMALLPLYALPNAKIYCSQYAFMLCFSRLIATAGGNAIVTLGGVNYPTYLNIPIVISQKMVSTSPSGKIGIMFGDLRKAAILAERRETDLIRADQRYIDTDQIGLFGSERMDIVCHSVGDTVTPALSSR